MKKFLPTIVFVLSCAACVFSQNATPTPSPRPSDDKDVVKISTNLIQIDVTVTDSKGRIVTDLNPDEIEIYENGKKQTISNFSFVAGPKTTTEKKKTNPTEKSTSPIPQATVRPEQIRRTMAIIVDDLTLSNQSVYYVRRAVKKFVDEQMQDGDLVAIIRTGAGIGALQQFTTDKRLLYAAIDRIRWNAYGAGKIGAFDPMQEVEPALAGMNPSTKGEKGIQDPKQNEEGFQAFRESVFATGTLGAIDYVIRGMDDLPGRKAVLLLSDGFTLFTRNDDGSIDSRRVMDSMRRLVDAANRASVVVYTMDARGLVYTGLTAADGVSLQGANAGAIEKIAQSRSKELFETQGGLVYLAKQTGGKSIINNNDLSDGIREILDDQSYYLVGYQPDDETFDPRTRRFNSLTVKLKRPGLQVRYRSGFFGVSDDKIRKPEMSSGRQMVSALASPFVVNGISLRLNAIFSNNAAQGSFIRSLLHVKAQDLTFTDEPDGSKRTIFDILAAGIGDNGVAIEHLSKIYTVTVKKEIYERFVRDGFVYDFMFPIKKPGAYQLRVALRDHATEKIGSANQFIEVPDVNKKNLLLSGVYLENPTFEEWSKRSGMSAAEIEKNAETNPLSDTSLRQFKRGTVLNYGFGIFNAKLDAAKKPNLTMQIKVYREGKLLLDGAPKPVPLDDQTDMQRIGTFGSLNLGTDMEAGDYILQIIIKDELADKRKQISTQFVQFEIVD